MPRTSGPYAVTDYFVSKATRITWGDASTLGLLIGGLRRGARIMIMNVRVHSGGGKLRLGGETI